MPIDAVAAWLIPGIGLASGLIAACVSLQNRALLAEVRRELAEVENRIILRLNGICIRRFGQSADRETHRSDCQAAERSRRRRPGGPADGEGTVQGRISPADS
jgi:hypothetical protein